MKIRWLVLTAILFALWGCEAPQQPESLPATEPEGAVVTAEPTVPSGLYMPGHPLEQTASGALHVFPLDQQHVRGIRFLGEDLLIFSGLEGTVLTLLSGEERYISAQAELTCTLFPDTPSLAISAEGFTYYDEAAHALVTLDCTLSETDRLAIPKTISGPIVLSPDCNSLYYCTDKALRIFSPKTGIDRPLAQMSFETQEPVGIHRDGAVLECRISTSDGHESTRFLSSETGHLLYETDSALSLWTEADFYFALRYEDYWPELLSGSSHYGPSSLVTETPVSGIMPIPALRSLILSSEKKGGKALQLDYFDLEAGTRIAQLQLPLTVYPMHALGDSQGNVWFHSYDTSTQEEILCCWDIARSEIQDTVNYLQPVFSPEEPDYRGLEQCRQRADILSTIYDVQILIWTDATSCEPWDYTLVPEYRVPVISRQLELLGKALSRYPEGFLKEAASQASKLRICLVRSIHGNPGSGSLDRTGGLQFWDENAQAYAALVTGPDLVQNLHHELFHIIESQIYGKSSALDNWSALNPKDFQYDFDYIRNSCRDSWELTQGEDRAFIDCYSMSFPKEDRARIMEYAMMPDQELIFACPTLQQKLRVLCLGIREAFDLQKHPSALPWEQYLEKPLCETP